MAALCLNPFCGHINEHGCKMQCLLKFVLLHAPKSNKTRQAFGPVLVRKSADIAAMTAVTAFQKITSIPNTVSWSGTNTPVPVVFSIEKSS